VTLLALAAGSSEIARAQVYDRPTYSSPIAISRDDKLIFAVNPGDDSVTVVRPDNNTAITKISVGDEPQSAAKEPPVAINVGSAGLG
jgi:YVTN family beta-propeller protein